MKTARNIRQTKAIFIMSSQQQTCERSCTGQDRNVTTHLDARKRIFLYVTSAFFRNPERMSIYRPDLSEVTRVGTDERLGNNL